jgi:hypothetical protein
MVPSATINVRSVVLDCPDPARLASFYADLLDGQLHIDDAAWCEVHVKDSGFKLAFQKVAAYEQPDWPDGAPQQLHLDLTVSDLTAACNLAASLGAVGLTGRVEEEDCVYLVHADPAGHPFCLCEDR